MNTDAALDLLERQLRRERAARKSAEARLERKSLELFNANLELRSQNAQLVTLNGQLESAHVQLLQAEMLASLGQLAAGVAHEINNPIGFVQCNLGTPEEYLDALLQLLDAYAALEQPRPAEDRRLAALRALQRSTDLGYLREDARQLIQESRASREGPRLWVEIADNGCGIPAELQARVFEPFFTTRPVGQGSRFRLWLPLRQPAEA